MKVQLLTLENDLLLYADNYKQITSNEIPISYLKNNLVYGFYKNHQLVAGFVVGIQAPFRTIQLFAPSDKHQELMQFMNDGKEVCEVCCFWEYKEQVTIGDNAFIWFNMSQKVNVSGKKFFLGGTVVKGLANLYGYPTYAHLISKGEVNSKMAYVFIAWRKYAVISAVQVMAYKTLKLFTKTLGVKVADNIYYDDDALKKVAKELRGSMRY